MNSLEDNRNVTHSPLRAPPLPEPPLSVTGPAGSMTALQQRAELMLSRSLPHARYQLIRVGPAGLTGIGVTAAAAIAAIVLLLPAHRSMLALRDELTKAGHTLPSAVKPAQSPEQFAASLPTRQQIPGILRVVLAQATEAGVALEQGRYTFSPATSSRLARYTFEFPVKAGYGNIRSFIDKSLAAIPALGLDKLHVERKTVGDVVVNADVGFVIYLRGA